MLGLIMNRQLTITSLMEHARKFHGDAGIVSVTADEPLHRCTYREAFARSARLANALARLVCGGASASARWPGTTTATSRSTSRPPARASCATPSTRACSRADRVHRRARRGPLALRRSGLRAAAGSAEAPARLRRGFRDPRASGAAANTTLRNAVDYETLIADEPDTFDWPELDENSACSMCYTRAPRAIQGVVYSHRALVLHTYGCLMPDVMNLSAREVVMRWCRCSTSTPGASPMAPPWSVPSWCSRAEDGRRRHLAAPDRGEGVTVTAGVPTVWLALLAHLERTGKTCPR